MRNVGYIDHVGYKADGEQDSVPLNSTIQHRAYFKVRDFTPKVAMSVDGSSDDVVIEYWSVSFEVVDSVTHEPVSGAETYVDHV